MSDPFNISGTWKAPSGYRDAFLTSDAAVNAAASAASVPTVDASTTSSSVESSGIDNYSMLSSILGSIDLGQILKDNREAQTLAALQQQAFAQSSADKAMAFNARQAQINRDWQEMMSNSAYQRTVADLKAAGLNPMLAVGNGATGFGSGATATGSAATGVAASVDVSSATQLIGSVMSSALQVLQISKQFEASMQASKVSNINNINTNETNKTIALMNNAFKLFMDGLF